MEQGTMTRQRVSDYGAPKTYIHLPSDSTSLRVFTSYLRPLYRPSVRHRRVKTLLLSVFRYFFWSTRGLFAASTADIIPLLHETRKQNFNFVLPCIIV